VVRITTCTSDRSGSASTGVGLGDAPDRGNPAGLIEGEAHPVARLQTSGEARIGQGEGHGHGRPFQRRHRLMAEGHRAVLDLLDAAGGLVQRGRCGSGW
jgi:hypothetical protein